MMFRPASLYIGLRYTRAKRKNNFISLISMVSLLGIAIGVCVLITVLSVMNGFDKEIRQRVFSMIPPLTITSQTGALFEWQTLQKELEKKNIVASAPFVTTEVLLSYGGSVQPSLISGILPEEENNITVLGHKFIEGHLKALRPGEFGMVLGEELAAQLGAQIGDKVTVVTPQVVLSPVGVNPRLKRFTVVGIFRAGSGFGFDKALSFIHLDDAQKLMGYGKGVTGLHLKIANPYIAPLIANTLRESLPPTLMVSTWADQFGEFFHAVQLEKSMMFIILLMIIAVAAFNLVSTLIMVVNEKESDIAILRTIGATPRMIMGIFLFQGSLIGILGTVLGVLAGILLATHVTEIVNLIEHTFNVQFLSSSVYLVDYLPSVVLTSDILKITFVSILLSLTATLYPAWSASKLDPVESLRYE